MRLERKYGYCVASLLSIYLFEMGEKKHGAREGKTSLVAMRS